MNVVIASDSVHEGLFADISYGNEFWSRVIYDATRSAFIVEFFPSSMGDPYVFDLVDVQAALEKAKQRLLALSYGHE